MGVIQGARASVAAGFRGAPGAGLAANRSHAGKVSALEHVPNGSRDKHEVALRGAAGAPAAVAEVEKDMVTRNVEGQWAKADQ